MSKAIFKTTFIFVILNTIVLANSIDDTYRFAATISKYDNVHKGKIKTIVKKMTKQFEDFAKRKAQVSLISDSKVMINDYVNNNYDSITLYTNDYLKNKKLLKENSQYFFTFDYKEEFKEYVLLVNKKSGINSIKDIKNKTYVNFIKSDNQYSNWLDYLSLKGLKKGYEKLIKKENRVSKDSTLVLEVYFNKADFTVVRKNVYDDMIALNPAIKKRVAILKKSKPIFIFGIGMFNKKTPKQMVEVFDKSVQVEIFNRQYKYVLRILGEAKMVRADLEDFAPLEKFYDEYIELKSKY